MKSWLEHIKAILEVESIHLDPEAVDLDLRQQVMHEGVDKFVFEGSLPTDTAYTSHFIGLPVTFRSPILEHSLLQGELPNSYRGGIWIYAIAEDHWSLSAENCLLDMARLLGLLYESQYGERAARELHRLGKNEAISAIFTRSPKILALSINPCSIFGEPLPRTNQMSQNCTPLFPILTRRHV